MRDEAYVGTLRDHYSRHRVFPPFAAIAKLLGLRSTSSVSALVTRLKDRGYLESDPFGRLAPGPRFFEREVLGSVRAGAPHPATETLLATVTIDEHLVPVPSRCVLLRIKGDSMQDAGLLEGDTVVVQKGAPSKPGDIVVAIVDDEFTVKTLAWDDRAQEFYLRPANKAYGPIRPRENLELFGKVVSAFRSYGPSPQHRGAVP